MQDALTTAIESMLGDSRRLASIGNNMANVLTTGYKREVRDPRPFADAMKAAAGPAAVDLSAGALRSTGRVFDLALDGDGLLEVMTPDGAAYTRTGSFHLDAAGRLVTEAGHPLQGMAGDIVLKHGAAQVEASGRIVQEGQAAAQLKIVKFAAGQPMQRAAHGLLRPIGDASALQASGASVRAGYLEGSNVKPLHEMVALTETARHFEAAQKLFQGYDEQLNAAIRTLAQF